MARHLPPPEEFRGAAPAGGQGADGSHASPLDGPVVLDSPARPASHRLTPLPTAASGRVGEVAFAPAQASQECGATLSISPARRLEDSQGPA